MKSELPIIIVNKGKFIPGYLVLALAQAKRTNLHSPVFLISDSKERPLPFIEYADLTEFKEGTEKLAKIYFHMSENDYWFERICIERWFVIREFMARQGFNQCFCLDSDVLVFSEISKILQEFSRIDLAMSGSASWGTVLFNKREVLDAFCEMVLEVYNRAPDIWPEMAARLNFSVPYAPLGNLCDMGLISLFVERNSKSLKYLDFSRVINAGVFDPNINTEQPGFEMKNGMKHIIWVDGFPHGQLVSSGELVRFHVLHFQGMQAKALMQQIFEEFTPFWAQTAGLEALDIMKMSGS